MPPVPPSAEQLPLRWALILVAAALIAVLVGVLTMAQSRSWPAALLAALGAGGASVSVLHQVLAR